MKTLTKTVYVVRDSKGKYLLFHHGGVYKMEDIFQATFFHDIEWAQIQVVNTDRELIEFDLTGIVKGQS